ncbi:hypothetical protein AMTR_s00110p00070440 [Amborella trichopoda]|uniref:TPX2 C-terminal domain-containing protein n=1 Tax=Amborella trichopoda TaxID=13333 RepID=W1NX92_AMBTC|nr:hypothetical protein AMTR_s00110p00070440 [Amborella trichopoda]
MISSKNPLVSPQPSRTSKRISENFDPNLSPAKKNGDSQSKRPETPASTRSRSKSKRESTNKPDRPNVRRVRERKFIIAKKHSKPGSSAVTCTCSQKNGDGKCLCMAYESLRASQEEFFNGESKNFKDKICLNEEGAQKPEDMGGFIDHERPETPSKFGVLERENTSGAAKIEPIERGNENGESMEEPEVGSSNQRNITVEIVEDGNSNLGSPTPKKLRRQLLEEAMNNIPQPGSGRVMHLVKAFERLLSIPREERGMEKNDGWEEGLKVKNWALPGLQPPVAEPTFNSHSSFALSSSCSSSEVSSSKVSDGDLRSSIASSDCSWGSRTSGGGRRSRKNSMESIGRGVGQCWKKQLKVTSQQPFKLRTEQRGRVKKEEFVKKVEEMFSEEERLRIPVAQGLPWTTDEPECLVKPPVKESTRPIDLKLHSDIRAVERAEFDQAIQEKLSFIEQYRQEEERRQKVK